VPPGLPALAVRPAVFCDDACAVSNSVSVCAISVTSANWTLMKRVATCDEGLSISFLRSMSLRMSEVFSVMTTAEAFGTAAMEPKAPN
jgi:hypothetical protein